MEAELLYRAALKYDLSTLLEEERAVLDSFPIQEIDETKLRHPIFWANYLESLKPGEVVGINPGNLTDPEEFDLRTWGMIIAEGETKKVVFLSDKWPRKEETRDLLVPRDFNHVLFSEFKYLNIFNLRKTGISLDPKRVKEIGLAQALVEKEAGAELIL